MIRGLLRWLFPPDCAECGGYRDGRLIGNYWHLETCSAVWPIAVWPYVPPAEPERVSGRIVGERVVEPITIEGLAPAIREYDPDPVASLTAAIIAQFPEFRGRPDEQEMYLTPAELAERIIECLPTGWSK